MQRTYAESNNGDGTGFSWRHYTNTCNACPSGNTNSYAPDNLLDDPLSNPSAGGDFCTDSGFTAGWVAFNLTEPTLITSYKMRARNWNEFPKTFTWQGSNDWVNWVDIETRSTASHQMQTNEERVFWVGVPSDVPGIPVDTMAEYNANPFLYGGEANNRNVCVPGDLDANRGLAAARGGERRGRARPVTGPCRIGQSCGGSSASSGREEAKRGGGVGFACFG